MSPQRNIDFSSLEEDRQIDFSSLEELEGVTPKQIDFSTLDERPPRPDFISAAFEGFKPKEEVPAVDEGDTYAEILGKTFAGGFLEIPKGIVAVEKVKQRAEKEAEETFRPFLPKPAGTPEERAEAIAAITGKPYEPPVKRPGEKAVEAPWLKPLEKAINVAEEYYKPEIKGTSRGKRIAAQFGHTAGAMLSQLPLIGLVGLAVNEGAQSSQRTLEKGAPLSTSLAVGGIKAFSTWATELDPTKTLLKPGMTFFRRLGRGLLVDSIGEEIDALGTEMWLIDEKIMGGKHSKEEYKQAFWDVLAVSGLFTTSATTVTHPAVKKQVELEDRRMGEIPLEEPTGLPFGEPDELPPAVLPPAFIKRGLVKPEQGYGPIREAVSIVSGEALPEITPEQLVAEDVAELEKTKNDLEDTNKKISKLKETAEDFKRGTHLNRQRRFLEKKAESLSKIIESEVPQEVVPAAITEIIPEPTKKVVEPVEERVLPEVVDEPPITEEEAPAPAVISGTLPIDRSGEVGGISINAPATKEGDLSVTGRTFNRFREFWMPLSTIPKSSEYLSARYKAFGDVARVERVVGRVWDKTKDLSPKNKQKIFNYLDGDIKIDALPKEVRGLAVSIQGAIRRTGQMLVKRGMLNNETFEANKDQYVRYMYLKHFLGDKTDMRMGRGGKMDLSYLKSRKDLTKEQQRAIGLIEDVSVAVPTGLSQSLSDIVKYDFFDKIADEPKWVFKPSMVKVFGTKMGIGALTEEVKIAERMHKQAPDVPEIKDRLNILKNALDEAVNKSKNVPQDFVQLPISKGMGPLSGAFVRKEVARDIMPIFSGVRTNNLSKMVDMVLDAEAKAMAAFKVGKTALNIPTAFRNTVSNVIQLNMSGIPLQDMPKHMVAAAVSMKNKNNYYVQARRNGLFRTNWGIAEIGEVLDTVKTMQKKNDVFAGLSKMAKYYGKIDDFFKLTKYIEQRTAGKPIQESILEAQKWGMDYSLAHPVIKGLRKHAAPFISYQYKVLPLVLESLAKRPWVIGKYLALPLILNTIAKKKLNLSDEEWEEMRKNLPTYLSDTGTYTALPWRSKTGNAQWVNLEYYLPWSGIVNVGRDITKGQFGELATDVGLGNPILDIYTVLKTTKGDTSPKDPFTGRDIYNQLDSPSDKAIKLSEWVYNKWAPSMLTKYGTLGKAARIGEPDRYGREITAGQAAASLLGFNIVEPTKKQANIERRAMIKQLKVSLFRIMRDPSISQEEKASARKEYIERLRIIRTDPKESLTEIEFRKLMKTLTEEE